MSTKANYYKIGLFVLSTVAMLVLGVIALSMRVLERDVVRVETYIDESVLGLSVGSAVMQRGVEIGRVERITFVPFEYHMPQGSEDALKYGKYVMVIMAIDKANFPHFPDEHISRIIDSWVENGLRLKLSYQGITGLAYIEADYVDVTRYDPMEVTWEPKHIYVPSVPSLLSDFTQSLDTIFRRIDSIDFEGLVSSMDKSLKSLQQAIADAEITRVKEELISLSKEMRETNKLIIGLIDDSKGDAAIPEALEQFRMTLKRMDQFILSQESNVSDIMVNLRRASANLRDVTEQAKKYPSQILLGKPPEHSVVTE